MFYRNEMCNFISPNYLLHLIILHFTWNCLSRFKAWKTSSLGFPMVISLWQIFGLSKRISTNTRFEKPFHSVVQWKYMAPESPFSRKGHFPMFADLVVHSVFLPLKWSQGHFTISWSKLAKKQWIWSLKQKLGNAILSILRKRKSFTSNVIQT